MVDIEYVYLGRIVPYIKSRRDDAVFPALTDEPQLKPLDLLIQIGVFLLVPEGNHGTVHSVIGVQQIRYHPHVL